MKQIVIINTGGTFSKEYNAIDGTLKVSERNTIIEEIGQFWRCRFDTLHIIHKDSLEMTRTDRLELLININMQKVNHIVVVHGTDTMEITANYLAEAETKKQIVLTGAMVPYRINPIEATANLASAIGFLQNNTSVGVYIAMNGLVTEYAKITKDRNEGRFVLKHSSDTQ